MFHLATWFNRGINRPYWRSSEYSLLGSQTARNHFASGVIKSADSFPRSSWHSPFPGTLDYQFAEYAAQEDRNLLKKKIDLLQKSQINQSYIFAILQQHSKEIKKLKKLLLISTDLRIKLPQKKDH